MHSNCLSDAAQNNNGCCSFVLENTHLIYSCSAAGSSSVQGMLCHLYLCLNPTFTHQDKSLGVVCPNKTHKSRPLKSKLRHEQENKAHKDLVGIWILKIRMISALLHANTVHVNKASSQGAPMHMYVGKNVYLSAF